MMLLHSITKNTIKNALCDASDRALVLCKLYLHNALTTLYVLLKIERTHGDPYQRARLLAVFCWFGWLSLTACLSMWVIIL